MVNNNVSLVRMATEIATRELRDVGYVDLHGKLTSEYEMKIAFLVVKCF